jgi:hypothetical protein
MFRIIRGGVNRIKLESCVYTFVYIHSEVRRWTTIRNIMNFNYLIKINAVGKIVVVFELVGKVSVVYEDWIAVWLLTEPTTVLCSEPLANSLIVDRAYHCTLFWASYKQFNYWQSLPLHSGLSQLQTV